MKPNRFTLVLLCIASVSFPISALQAAPVAGGEPSPDGTHIARAIVYNNPGIEVVDSAGKNPRRIYNGKVNFDLAWSPDGKSIAFVAIENDSYQIRTATIDGKNSAQITHGEKIVSAPQFTANDRVAYIAWREQIGKTHLDDLMVSDGRQSTVLASHVFISSYRFSPDHEILAYGTIGELVFKNLKTGKSQKVTYESIDSRLGDDAVRAMKWKQNTSEVECQFQFIGGMAVGGDAPFEGTFSVPIPKELL